MQAIAQVIMHAMSQVITQVIEQVITRVITRVLAQSTGDYAEMVVQGVGGARGGGRLAFIPRFWQKIPPTEKRTAQPTPSGMSSLSSSSWPSKSPVRAEEAESPKRSPAWRRGGVGVGWGWGGVGWDGVGVGCDGVFMGVEGGR